MCKLVDGDVFPKVPANPSNNIYFKNKLKNPDSPPMPYLSSGSHRRFSSALLPTFEKNKMKTIFSYLDRGTLLYQISLLTGTQVVAPSPRALSSQKSDKEILKVLKNIYFIKLGYFALKLDLDLTPSHMSTKITFSWTKFKLGICCSSAL